VTFSFPKIETFIQRNLFWISWTHP